MMKTKKMNRSLIIGLIAFGITSLSETNNAANSRGSIMLPNTPLIKEQKNNIPYVAITEKFSVVFPKELNAPERSEQPVETDAGEIVMVQVVASSHDGNTAAMIMYGAYPEEAFEGKTSSKMLDDIRDGAMKSGEAKLAKEENYSFNGKPARRCFFNVMMGEQKGYARFDFILAKPALYQVAFISMKKATVLKKSTQDFFKSFKITEWCQE